MNLFEKFNITSKNKELYEIAFTHSSYAEFHNLNYNYERLEFLGDSILNLIISEYIYNKYPYYGEGKLTKLRANYVCQNALIYYSNKLNLKEYLKVSAEELNLTKNEIIYITADVFESLIGAMFLDKGMEFTKEFISKTIFKYIDDEKIFFNDYKSKIKEYCDANDLDITYKVLKEYGVPHDKTFIIACYINSHEYGLGKGKNKKDAEQSAAKFALTKLKSGVD